MPVIAIRTAAESLISHRISPKIDLMALRKMAAMGDLVLLQVTWFKQEEMLAGTQLRPVLVKPGEISVTGTNVVSTEVHDASVTEQFSLYVTLSGQQLSAASLYLLEKTRRISSIWRLWGTDLSQMVLPAHATNLISALMGRLQTPANLDIYVTVCAQHLFTRRPLYRPETLKTSFRQFVCDHPDFLSHDASTHAPGVTDVCKDATVQTFAGKSDEMDDFRLLLAEDDSMLVGA
ncbi:hypothetical protein BaRGS_00016241, partial [Batillaria attramentaria]